MLLDMVKGSLHKDFEKGRLLWIIRMDLCNQQGSSKREAGGIRLAADVTKEARGRSAQGKGS